MLGMIGDQAYWWNTKVVARVRYKPSCLVQYLLIETDAAAKIFKDVGLALN